MKIIEYIFALPTNSKLLNRLIEGILRGSSENVSNGIYVNHHGVKLSSVDNSLFLHYLYQVIYNLTHFTDTPVEF